jgi:YegS/Rv2252/BmrU family lipid kinase
MRAVVVINPISGPRRHRSVADCTALARDVFTRHGIAAEVRVTTARGDARAFGQQARADGAEIVVAWGGDGTINEVGSAIAFSDVALGIVPGGSGNGLARDLGIPLHAERALEIAASGRRRRIDAGQIDTALFFNVAGIGLDALIARHIAHPKAQRGLTGYARVTFVELPRYRAQRYEIECEGRCSAERAVIIALANSRQYGNGALIAPAARLDDGRLDLVVVKAQPLWRILARLPHLFRGTLSDAHGVTMESMTGVTIRSTDPIAYHADGEPGLAASTVQVRVHPAALSVIVSN